MRAKILIIEDEPSIADALVYALQSENFDTRWESTGAAGLAAARRECPDCVVLDVGLPDMTGFDVCRALRAFSDVPVIFLTARDGEIDRVVGLELGADDYVVKPFSPRELAARVRAILRRTSPQRNHLALGNGGNGIPSPAEACDSAAAQPEPPVSPAPPRFLQHDPVRMQIHCLGQVLSLTRNEYRLLAVLIASPGRVFSRDQLMEAAWDDPASALDRTVDAHVKSLRAKLRAIAPDSEPLQTHRGLGYSLSPEAAS